MSQPDSISSKLDQILEQFVDNKIPFSYLNEIYKENLYIQEKNNYYNRILK
jgi:hypothetical protein